MTHLDIDLEWPEQLWEAQESGRLVIFAGAGVSRSAPSNGPSFSELAAHVQSQTGVIKDDRDGEDLYLGKVEEACSNVHEIVRSQIIATCVHPNTLHENLLKLFGVPSNVRIVTTNFDTLFERAAEGVFGDLPEVFQAPSLPMGAIPPGLIYLHGSVDKPSNRLVITDRDFGRAYLYDNWATRFLSQLFLDYTVLFVGYSHRDTVVRYLARSLPPQRVKARYTLGKPGSPEEEEYWTQLGVTYLALPTAPDISHHETLPMVIRGWVEDTRTDPLLDETRLTELLAGPIPTDQRTVRYLRSALKKPGTAKLFADHAQGLEWLDWASRHSVLDHLFQTISHLTDADQQLAAWVAQEFFGSDPGKVISVAQEHGGKIHPKFWSYLAYGLFRRDSQPSPQGLGYALTWLLSKYPGPGYATPIECIAQDLMYPEQFDIALLLLSFFCRPSTGFRSYGDQVSPSLQFPSSTDALSFIWKQFFLNNLSSAAPRLISVLTDSIRYVGVLWRAILHDANSHDRLDLGRGSIVRDDPEDNHDYDGENWLISRARDTIEALLTALPNHANEVIAEWIAGDETILQRLAVHAMQIHPTFSPGEKVRWLIEHEAIFLGFNSNESWNLLQGNYARLTMSERRCLLDAIDTQITSYQGDTTNDEERPPYQITVVYRLLRRLADADPDCELSRSHLLEMKADNPELSGYDVRVSTKVGSGWWEDGATEITPSIIISVPTDDAIRYLTDDEHPVPRFQFLNIVSDAAETDFRWSYGIASQLVGQGLWSSDLWDALVRGWGRRDHSYTEWNDLFTLLTDHICLFAPQLTNTIIHMLEAAVSDTDRVFPIKAIGKALALVESLWDRIPEREPVPHRDWLTAAINHPGGDLANFVILALDRQRRANPRTTLPKRYRDILERVIIDDSFVAEMGRVVIASNLDYLIAVAPDWSKKWILPLFEWNDERRAQQCWNGFLVGGRFTRQLIPIMLPLMRKSIDRVSTSLDIGSEEAIARSGFLRLAAVSMTIYDQLTGQEKLDLSNGLVSKLNSEGRGHWTFQIAQHLARLTKDDITTQWNTWLRSYMKARINVNTKSPNTAEMKQFRNLVLKLRPVFTDAVNILIVGIPPVDDHYTYFLSDIAKSGLLNSHPSDMARLISFALEGIPGLIARYNYPMLQEILVNLHEAGLPASQREMRNLRMTLFDHGYSTAELFGSQTQDVD